MSRQAGVARLDQSCGFEVDVVSVEVDMLDVGVGG